MPIGGQKAATRATKSNCKTALGVACGFRSDADNVSTATNMRVSFRVEHIERR